MHQMSYGYATNESYANPDSPAPKHNCATTLLASLNVRIFTEHS